MSPNSLAFELHVFTEPPAVKRLLPPPARRALFVDGVPKRFIGRRYWADHDVELLDLEGPDPILRFGYSGISDAIGVKLSNGNVIEVLDAPNPARFFVNSSVEKFTRTVQAAISRFPYYSADAYDEDFQSVATELSAIIRGIDPAAAMPDAYWATFVDDVAIGDLSTEAVLASIG